MLPALWPRQGCLHIPRPGGVHLCVVPTSGSACVRACVRARALAPALATAPLSDAVAQDAAQKVNVKVRQLESDIATLTVSDPSPP